MHYHEKQLLHSSKESLIEGPYKIYVVIGCCPFTEVGRTSVLDLDTVGDKRNLIQYAGLCYRADPEVGSTVQLAPCGRYSMHWKFEHDAVRDAYKISYNGKISFHNR